MQLFISALSMLLIIAAWIFMIKKTVIDHHRDALFDMRDSLRRDFLSKGWSLESDLYKQLRTLVNGYLRHTEKFSFTQFSYLETRVKNSPELQTMLRKLLEEKFSNLPEEQSKYAQEFRGRALNIILNYMVFSSGPLLILVVLMIPVVAGHLILKMLQGGFLRGARIVWNKIAGSQLTFATILDRSLERVTTKVFEREFVEELSFARYKK